jgi:WXG100 family type VII secretion target
MKNIRVTPSELRRRAKVINQNADDVKRDVDKINELVDGLRPTFIGNRASKFFKEFDSVRGNMQKWDDIIRSFAEQLERKARDFEIADRQ